MDLSPGLILRHGKHGFPVLVRCHLHRHQIHVCSIQQGMAKEEPCRKLLLFSALDLHPVIALRTPCRKGSEIFLRMPCKILFIHLIEINL